MLTWNFWAVTESALRGENPYETNLVFHPLGSNLAAHTLGPGFLPIGLAAKFARGGAPDYPLFARRASILVCFALGMFLAHYALRALGSGALPATAAAVGWGFAACWHPSLLNQTSPLFRWRALPTDWRPSGYGRDYSGSSTPTLVRSRES